MTRRPHRRQLEASSSAGTKWHLAARVKIPPLEIGPPDPKLVAQRELLSKQRWDRELLADRQRREIADLERAQRAERAALSQRHGLELHELWRTYRPSQGDDR